VRDTLVLEDSTGAELFTVGEKKLHIRDTMEIERAGQTDHEHKIDRSGKQVAEVSKSWFRVRDTYGIEIAHDQDDALTLATTVCIDQMTHV
jgi:uncharacterized protein YxjI